jgi:hypothetical protein
MTVGCANGSVSNPGSGPSTQASLGVDVEVTAPVLDEAATAVTESHLTATTESVTSGSTDSQITPITQETAAITTDAAGTTEASSVPADWTPTPSLSQDTLDDNPLLDDMLGASEFLRDPEFAPYIAAIGVSQYVVVDANGDPIETDEGLYNQRSILITAYHGREQPIVYLLIASASYDDADYGYQTDDRSVRGSAAGSG